MLKYNGLIPSVYIAPDGDDSTGDGSEENPYLTLTKAVAETDVQDVIGLKNGTYTMATALSFDMDANRHYAGEERGKVVVDAIDVPSVTANGYWRNGTTDAETSIHNIVYTNALLTTGVTSATFQHNMGTASSILEYHNCVFQNMIIDGNPQAGGLMARDGDRFRVKFFGCIWSNISEPGQIGANMFNIRNDFRKIWELYNCTIVLNDTVNPIQNVIGSDNMSNKTLVFVTIKNTIVANYAASTPNLLGTTQNTTEPDNFITKNNCYFDIGGNSINFGTGHIIADPKLIDFNKTFLSDPYRAFALQTISPCIGAGTGDI